MLNSRVLAVDYGSVRTGFAISDDLKITAQRLCTLSEKNLKKVVEFTIKLIDEYNVEKVVVGIPRNMNGSEGERCLRTRGFIKMLGSRVGVSILEWDERLSTVAALKVLREIGVKRKIRDAVVDQFAAHVVLESYLNSCVVRD